jgi:hypothetical protein
MACATPPQMRPLVAMVVVAAVVAAVVRPGVAAVAVVPAPHVPIRMA